MTFSVIIPARLGSTRLPNKPLADIAGQPMIVRCAQQAALSGARQVWVATDSQAVLEAVQAHGFQALLTDAEHPTGTDRLAQAARLLELPEDEIVVNVQGDEPLISARAYQCSCRASGPQYASRYRHPGCAHQERRNAVQSQCRQGGVRPAGPRPVFLPRPYALGPRCPGGRRTAAGRRTSRIAPYRPLCLPKSLLAAVRPATTWAAGALRVPGAAASHGKRLPDYGSPSSGDSCSRGRHRARPGKSTRSLRKSVIKDLFSAPSE